MKALEGTTQIQRDPSQVFTEVDGEIIMLNVKKEAYYSLNETGSLIWKESENKISFDALVEKLTDIFEVPAEQCRKEVEPFLHELVTAGVILLSNE